MANIVPANVNRIFRQLKEDIDRAFDRFLSKRSGNEMQKRADDLWSPFWTDAGFPSVSISEDDENIVVKAELPGMDESDLNVEISGNRLVLSGEKKQESEEKKKNYYYSECVYGSFTRTIPLPAEIDVEKATARFKKGVLKVTLPKTNKGKTKRISVTVS